MKLHGSGPYAAFSNATLTFGTVAVNTPHNEKPIGCYSTSLLRDLVEDLEEREVEEAYLWTIDATDKPSLLVATTTDDDPGLGLAVAPLREDRE